MKKNEYAYKVMRVVDGNYQKLVISVGSLMGFYMDVLNFTWQGNKPGDTGPTGWYGMRIEYEARKFDLMPVMKALEQNDRMRWGVEPEEVQAFLDRHNILLGTYMELHGEDEKRTFNGVLTLNEARTGGIIRGERSVGMTADERRIALNRLNSAMASVNYTSTEAVAN